MKFDKVKFVRASAKNMTIGFHGFMPRSIKSIHPKQPILALWRWKLARRFRRWADRIDGYDSIAITVIDTHGLLSREDATRAIEGAIGHANTVLFKLAVLNFHDDTVE